MLRLGGFFLHQKNPRQAGLRSPPPNQSARGNFLVLGPTSSGQCVQNVQVEASDDEFATVRTGAAGEVTTIGDPLPVRVLTTSRTPVVWRGLGGTFNPVVVDREFRVVLARQGSFDALADPSILSNATLSSSDNAVFALELLGSDGRVVFAEAGHGFRSGTGAGLSAIPSNVRTLLLGFVLAILVWMFAVGRRIGGPDLPDRPLPPGRFEHVAAVASLLDRAEKKNRSPASGDEAATPTQPKDA